MPLLATHLTAQMFILIIVLFFFFVQVALHFVKDEKTRFGLALECGNIEVKLMLELNWIGMQLFSSVFYRT